MKCALCDKEISKTYSRYGNYCQECSKKINDDLRTKNFNTENTFITPEKNIKEKPFSAYDPTIFNDNENPINKNYIAEKIESFNNIYLISNIIIIIILFISFFVNDAENITFLVVAFSELFLTLFVYYLISGLAEIINLLHEIKHILKNK